MKKTKINNHIKFQNSDFYFDDCPICQATKKAEDEGRNLNFSELKVAFKEANKKRVSLIN